MRKLGTLPDPDGLSQLLLRLGVSSTLWGTTPKSR